MPAIAMRTILAEFGMAACILLLGADIVRGDGTLRLSDAWIRHAPPSAQHHAGYFILANSGNSARYLVAAESPDYAKVELHASRVVDGVVSMEPAGDLEIIPGQAISFAPGGLHLMLIGPKTPTKVGSTVALTLVLRDGARLPVKAIVKTGDRSARQQPHQHDTQHHKH